MTSGPRHRSATSRYALCNDRRTLLWFANQRAVEYHPALVRSTDRPHRPTSCSTSTRPRARRFAMSSRAAHLVRAGAGRRRARGAVKTSGAKGVHVFVPIDAGVPHRGRGGRDPRDRGPGRAPRPVDRDDRVHQGGPGGKVFVDSTRAGGATVVAPTARGSAPACRCRSRWRGTTSTTSTPADFTVHTALDAARRRRPVGATCMPRRSRCPPTLVEEGRADPGRRACRRCTRASAAPAPGGRAVPRVNRSGVREGHRGRVTGAGLSGVAGRPGVVRSTITGGNR